MILWCLCLPCSTPQHHAVLFGVSFPLSSIPSWHIFMIPNTVQVSSHSGKTPFFRPWAKWALLCVFPWYPVLLTLYTVWIIYLYVHLPLNETGDIHTRVCGQDVDSRALLPRFKTPPLTSLDDLGSASVSLSATDDDNNAYLVVCDSWGTIVSSKQ